MAPPVPPACDAQQTSVMPCFAARIVAVPSTNGLAPPSTSPPVPTDIVFQVLLCRLRYKLS
ncbi:MAG TPA: hypothetical protein V6C65_33830, partial [Allocoleopsis sp.]